jgi:hypothetical protein
MPVSDARLAVAFGRMILPSVGGAYELFCSAASERHRATVAYLHRGAMHRIRHFCRSVCRAARSTVTTLADSNV